MEALSLAAAFQARKKNSSLIGSSTLILGSDLAPTRTLKVEKKNGYQVKIDHILKNISYPRLFYCVCLLKKHISSCVQLSWIISRPETLFA